MGMDNDLGSLEPGKLADIVVMDGDVLTDLRRSEYISHTMINGRLYDVSTMAEVASGDSVAQPLFFERLNINAMPAATAEALERKSQRYHWQH
ncbi:MAG: amidohydrolase family protein [Porticoccaceae bacterium]|jgi:adenine deaminase|nr:amidohydrolase family protein [Porticoccaceae bacterium]